MRDLSALTAKLAIPGVHVVTVDAPSKSYFGGSPRLPPGATWPMWRGRKLSFLARLSIEEFGRVMKVDWLPESGALLFFYDTEEQPWGFDPKDRGCCAIVHVPDLDAPAQSGGSQPTAGEYIAHRPVAFRRIETRPGWERETVRALSLSHEETDAYIDLLEEPFSSLPKHQIAGLPSPVQGDHMELECQLASHGQFCGDSSGYSGAKAKALEPGAKDWRLVLQLDSDDDLGVMWGDCGTLYFWAPEAEARRGSFENAWLVLQCA